LHRRAKSEGLIVFIKSHTYIPITMNFLSRKSSDAEAEAEPFAPKIDENAKNVVIVGAGPSGLLLSALLLKRNEREASPIKYKVTLVESRTDMGLLDPETELKAYKSWMIALAGHGLEAVRQIPELYDDYVADVGVSIKSLSIFLGSKELKTPAVPEDGNAGEAFIIDRNFVCAAIARYLHQKHGNDPYFERRYDTKLMYVDYENHQILTRKGDIEAYTKYELLVGSDGVRSIVREALVRRHFDFEMDIGDIFQAFKAVHIKLPKVLDPNSMSILPNVFPHMQGIALPEKEGQVNISMGVPHSKFDELAPELKSEDPLVVAAYFKENLKCFELDDYDDFAKKFVECAWNRTGMVHCNFYHSLPCKVVIMGDAAHATSPSIGMGMNTALRDAQKLCEILDRFEADLDQVLPQYSKERVKEGNSLTDLAYNLYCHETKHQMIETAHVIVRSVLNNYLPSLVSPHPQTKIGFPDWTLAEVYQLASDQGIIQKHRRVNLRIRQEYFEKQSGMITRTPGSQFPMWSITCLAGGLAIAVSYFLKQSASG
jgi:kynurenine 3-monooxygenase